MATLIPNKLLPFDRRFDALTVSTWQYQVYVYVNPLQANNPQVVMDGIVIFSVSSHVMKGNAANGWYVIVQSIQAWGKMGSIQVLCLKLVAWQDIKRRQDIERR